MDIRQLLEVLWRRKLTVVGVAVLVVGIAVAALQLATPVYESTSTMVLRPEGAADDFSFFYALEAIVPIYGNAATTQTTRGLAREELDGPLSAISVQTFRRTPIIRITARDEDPERAAASAQAVTDALLEQVDNAEIGVPSLELIQIDRPTVPSDPVFPRPTLTLLVASLLGLASGVGAAVLRESLSRKVETADALGEATGLPVYAEIPNVPAVKRIKSAEVLVNDKRYREVYESLRDLRTNLHFSNGDLRSIVITSPEGRHGKTTVAFGLAVTLARAGTKTLLVDGDLRRGRVSEMLGIPRGRGLVDVLQGAPLKAIVRPTSLDKLELLTGGQPIHDPGELLQARFAAVLDRLQELYEVVVIDSTPLVPVNDARIMASFAESTVIVASADTATRRQVRTAVERLSLISVNATAVVLNHAKTSTGGYYG